MSIPTILHASVLLPASQWGPGLPVLSMRRPWRWARLKTERAGGIWMPDSAPSEELLDRYPNYGTGWRAFAAEYSAEMLARSWILDELLRLGAADPRGGLVLLCWEREWPNGTLWCHRAALANMLRDRAASRPPVAAVPDLHRWEDDGGMPGEG